MGISVDWDNNEKTIILWTFSDPWTWEDFRVGFDRSYLLMRSVHHTVHILADARTVTKVPSGNILSNIRMLITRYPANLGLHVAVSENVMIRALGEMVGRLVPKSTGHGIHTVPTLDEAYQLLERASAKERKVEY
jgi:hypothetical protein